MIWCLIYEIFFGVLCFIPEKPSQPTKTRRGADLFHRPKRWAVRKSENKDLLRHHIGLSQGQSPGKPPNKNGVDF